MPLAGQSQNTFKPHLSIVASEMHHHIGGKLPGYKESEGEVGRHFKDEKEFGQARYPQSKGTCWPSLLFHPSMFVIDRLIRRCCDMMLWVTAINVLNVQTISQLAGDKVIVNSINPGFCHSELMRNSNRVVQLVVS